MTNQNNEAAQLIYREKERSRRYYLKNREKLIEKQKKYYRENAERERQRSKEWREKNPDAKRIWELQNKFGISLEEYDRLLKKQNGSCGICGVKESEKSATRPHYHFAVDHCHETGKVRGLLCTKCNINLGGFSDSKELLLAAINYLEEHDESE